MGSCKSDVEYNFATGSSRDELVFASARPGARGQRCFNPEDKVTDAEVLEWANFMKERGIARVVGLHTGSEMLTYASGPPAALLSANGLQTVNIDVDEADDKDAAIQAVLQAVEDAVAAKEKVVVHCWGGGGRAGSMLAAYLVKHYGLSQADAADEVMSHAKEQGASRRVVKH